MNKLYMITVVGTESSIEGPFPTEQERVACAKEHISRGHSTIRLDIKHGVPSVGDFLRIEIEDDVPFC